LTILQPSAAVKITCIVIFSFCRSDDFDNCWIDTEVNRQTSAVSRRQQQDSAAIEMALVPAVINGDNDQNYPNDNNDTSTSLCYQRNSEQLEP